MSYIQGERGRPTFKGGRVGLHSRGRGWPTVKGGGLPYIQGGRGWPTLKGGGVGLHSRREGLAYTQGGRGRPTFKGRGVGQKIVGLGGQAVGEVEPRADGRYQWDKQTSKVPTACL